jgi:hypothetical protein
MCAIAMILSPPCGHYLPKGMPDGTYAALRAFLLNKE